MDETYTPRLLKAHPRMGDSSQKLQPWDFIAWLVDSSIKGSPLSQGVFTAYEALGRQLMRPVSFATPQ